MEVFGRISQGNGQEKAANKLVLSALSKGLIGRACIWLDELSLALWAVLTTTRWPIGETPFALNFGSKAMALAELRLPTARVALFDQNQNDSNRLLNLDLLEENLLVPKVATRVKNS